MELTRNCIWNHQGEITQKVWKQELSFLYLTHRQDLFYITVQYHDYIPKGIQVTEWTPMHLKPSRGNNSESIKARVIILVHHTSLWPVSHNCEVSWLYSKGYSSYRADKKKHQRGDNSKSIKVSALTFVCDTFHDLFYITVKYHQNILNGIQVTERTRKCLRMDGRTPGSSLKKSTNTHPAIPHTHYQYNLLNSSKFDLHTFKHVGMWAGSHKFTGETVVTVKILKFGTPQTIAIIVLKLVKFDVTLH